MLLFGGYFGSVTRAGLVYRCEGSKNRKRRDGETKKKNVVEMGRESEHEMYAPVCV